jgi:DNA-binding transcriptional LysR family regulator
MELRQLRYFAAVADERNFTRAARRLHLSQPPLSRHISQLEKELGVALLIRVGKRFTLTEAGTFLHAEAKRIIEEVDACLRQTKLVGASSAASIRVAAAGSLMLSIVPEILARADLAAGGPRFTLLEMSTENQAQAILSGKIDLGFLRDWADTKGLAFEPLGREALAVVYPRAWAEGVRAFTSLADFANRPFVSGHEAQAPGLAEATRQLCAESGFQPTPAFECDHLPAMLKLVEAGLGWAIVPSAIVRSDEAVGTIELQAGLGYGMAYRRGNPGAGVETLAVAAREAGRAVAYGPPLPEAPIASIV